jgi:hypothetical protein
MVLTLLLQLACANGEVVISGAPGMGKVRSAFWTNGFSSEHFALDTAGELMDLGMFGLPPYIFLLDTPDGCQARQEWLTGWAEASGRFLVQERIEGVCAALPALLQDMADLDRAFPDPTISLEFTGCDEGGTCLAADTTYQDTDDVTVFLTYSDPTLKDGRYERALAAWSVEDCSYHGADDDELTVDDVYSYDGGRLDVAGSSGIWISGSLDADVQDHGADVGAVVSADFHVDWCEVPEDLGPTVTPGWI